MCATSQRDQPSVCVLPVLAAPAGPPLTVADNGRFTQVLQWGEMLQGRESVIRDAPEAVPGLLDVATVHSGPGLSAAIFDNGKLALWNCAHEVL